jgi:hypothetical protein
VRIGIDQVRFRALMECRGGARYAEHIIGVPAATVRDLREALVEPAA